MSIWADIHKRSSGVSVRKEDIYTFKDIEPSELAKMFKQGIVHFKYRKKAKKGQPWDSGEERDAWGTKKMDVVSKIPHGGDCPPKHAGYTIYFDVEKEDWRAFSDTLLLGVCPYVFSEEEYSKIIMDDLK